MPSLDKTGPITLLSDAIHLKKESSKFIHEGQYNIKFISIKRRYSTSIKVVDLLAEYDGLFCKAISCNYSH